MSIQGSDTGNYNGVEATITPIIEDCDISHFGGNNVEIYGQSGLSQTGYGNCDNWYVGRTSLHECGLNNLFIHGNDAQQGLARLVHASFAKDWNFWTDTPYVNKFELCNSEGGGAGAYGESGAMSYQGNLYDSCYTETGPGSNNDLHPGSLVINPAGAFDMSNAFSWSPLGFGVPDGGEWVFNRAGQRVWSVGTENRLDGLHGARFGDYPRNYMVIAGSEMAQVTDTDAEQTRMTFSTPSGQKGSITTAGSGAELELGSTKFVATLDDILARLAKAGI